MRCSTCSKRVKPIVAIDIDGTMGDYHGHFLSFAAKWMGIDFLPSGVHIYNGVGPFRDWFCTAFGVDATTFRQIKLAYRQGGMKRSMPAFLGMTTLTRTLHTVGCEVWVTTTRPYLRLDGVDPDTREWLRRREVHYDGLLYDEDKYGVLAQNVDPERVVAVLDDLPEQYDAAAETFGEAVPILVGGLYNRGVSRPSRVPVENIDQAVSLRLRQWKGIYELV